MEKALEGINSNKSMTSSCIAESVLDHFSHFFGFCCYAICLIADNRRSICMIKAESAQVDVKLPHARLSIGESQKVNI